MKNLILNAALIFSMIISLNAADNKLDAGAYGNVIQVLAEGTSVQVIQPQEGEWIEVICEGRQGFINYKYVSK